jgi:hypothetical protein
LFSTTFQHWCVLPFFLRSVRRRNMMRRIYPHHAPIGNRVGLHYSCFWPKSKTSLVANQVLSRLKNLEICFFDPESANSGQESAAPWSLTPTAIP